MPQLPHTELEETPAAPGQESSSLDPSDWPSFRAQAHRMLDDILDYTQNIRQRPVWQPIPSETRERFHASLPTTPTPLAHVHHEFLHHILPYTSANTHPAFLGWVQGAGTPVGMLGEMLAAGLNANLGGRDQIPIEVERQITRWMQTLFNFPESASGLFVTGTSLANFLAVKIARDAAIGPQARRRGVAAKQNSLTAYASAAVHSCIPKTLDLCGLGSDSLRLIPTDSHHRLDTAALTHAIQKDRDSGFAPFLLIGSAGTVDIGSIDPLESLAQIARREKLWFHIDGALGALAILAPDLAPKLAGVQHADSLAFDFHKWGQVPYDAGFLLVRDATLHRNAFAASCAYLNRTTRGLAAGSDWPRDFGVDLSRNFRALKTWFTFKTFGTQTLGAAISRTCELARYLERRIAATPELELLAPVELNIVCFRYRAADPAQLNALNSEIVIQLQESGIAAPSTTILDGRLAIRAAIVNHRTNESDLDTLLEKTLALGRALSSTITTTAVPATPAEPPAAPTSAEPPPRPLWEAELFDVDRQLASSPDSPSLRFRRACLLSELGRLGEARDDFIAVLKRDPQHLDALRRLGNVLIAMGHRMAARLVYHEAVTRHADDPLSHVNIGNFLLEEIERLVEPGQESQADQFRLEARAHFEQALRLQPGYDLAHEGLSYVLAALGDEPNAAFHRRLAFQNRSIIRLPYRGAREPLTVLQLVSATGGNVRLRRFLDNRIFQSFIVLPEFYDHSSPLPPHQLVVNGIGDPELSFRALAAAEPLLALTSAPILNPPAAVLPTSRGENAKRLAHLPGVITPITVKLSRAELSAPAAAASTLARHHLAFPLLLRSPGYHTGQYFLRVENPAALPDALAHLPGEELIVIQYVDARGSDGKIRKYRVMMIDGRLYPWHVAISNHWKVHYFSAEMAENPQHRAEDAAFLENMPAVLGPAAMNALAAIQSTLALDYAGIDFGLNSNGELLLFEANATMAVNPPDPAPRWQYRADPYRQIHTATQKMLLGLALQGPAWRSTRPTTPSAQAPSQLHSSPTLRAHT
jgi:aromatic-L-amino-acid/L-tryptophan decarboxylase